MGCPAEAKLESTLTFSIPTHDPDTGILTDADSPPTYRVYEDETAIPILTGSMEKLDDDNTTGFYTELIAVTAANGFEVLKTYTIYIEATVDGDKGGITYGFQVIINVWDEILTGATHNISSSSGRRLREIASSVIITGTSPDSGGTANTAIRIELDGDASAMDGAYDPSVVDIVAGTGAGQSRQIFQYDGANKYAYINRDWKEVPDDTSEYVIRSNSGNTHVNEGLAQGGSTTTIILNTLASTEDNIYNGQTIFLVAGIGQDQSRLVLDYDGGTKTATVAAWETNPTNGTIYVMLPSYIFTPGVPKNKALSNFRFTMLSSTDHITPVTGASVTAEIIKDAEGAFSASANSVSEIGSGVYEIDWDQAEMNADSITFKFTAAAADQIVIHIITSL